MTRDEAQLFLLALFKTFNNISDNAALSFENYFANSMVGHYQDKQFGINEFKKQAQLLLPAVKKLHFVIEDLAVADHLIICVTRFSWINNQNLSYHEAVTNLVLRINHEHQISEIWLMIDQEIMPNAQVSEALKRSEINQREKNHFLKRLSTNQYFYQDQWIELNETEKECIYYYLYGFGAKEAAQLMGLSHRTIETYLAAIKEKLNCTSKTALRRKLFPTPIEEKT